MENGTSRKIFVNLAVEDLDRSIKFFTHLGFRFDPNFSDEHSSGMIVSDEAYVMLLDKEFFKSFIKKELADSTTETIIALSADSREQVDELVHKAFAAGGRPANDPIEMDFMYGWSFQDPDGHLWELFYMDPSAMREEAREKQGAMAG
jgi:predicted lactoylglutathione lyase